MTNIIKFIATDSDPYIKWLFKQSPETIESEANRLFPHWGSNIIIHHIWPNRILSFEALNNEIRFDACQYLLGKMNETLIEAKTYLDD